MPSATSKQQAAGPVDIGTLVSRIPVIFTQVQHSQANHKKNLVALRKIQEECALRTEPHAPGKNVRLVGEKAFNNTFMDMLNRVLGLKKGIAQADKCVAFVGKYVAYTTEQDAPTPTEDPTDAQSNQEESTSTRFVNKLLRHLLSGCEAKEKNVRYRVVQTIVAMINGLGEVDDDLYTLLRTSLLHRATDKEPSIRVHATLGLAKLAGGEDPEELEDGESTLEEVIVGLMRWDPAPEVRRAALYNLPRTHLTLPHMITRTRDVDPTLRRSVYLSALSASSIPDPRVLSIEQRELIVKNGLGDREASVRRATGYMLNDWHASAGGDTLEFLKRFDVVGSQVAEDGFVSLLTTRPELLEQTTFDELYWETMTPEKAFMARVFVDHCRTIKKDELLERSLPSVTSLAFKIQDEYNQLDLLEPPPAVGQEEEDEEGEDGLPKGSAYVDKTFVIVELCKLAVNLDYSDELGRRKMFQLAREMISHPALPDSLIPACLNILSKISDSERDLIRLIVDVLTELRAVEDDDGASSVPAENQSYASSMRAPRRTARKSVARDDPVAREEEVMRDLRCLSILVRLLESVNGTLQQNSVLHGLIDDLIGPAIGNKHNEQLRVQGLLCLGLCGTIDSRLAAKHFQTLLGYAVKGAGELRIIGAKVIFDWLMTHGIAKCIENMPIQADQLVQVVQQILAQPFPEDESVISAVKAIACEGAAKLMLAGMVTDAQLLGMLVLLYMSEQTVNNLALRQCLSYFFPVFCYSAIRNQRLMMEIVAPTIDALAEAADRAVPLAQAALLLSDWTDPTKMVEHENASETDTGVHVDLAVELVKSLSVHTDREMRKVLAGLLGKLHLPECVDELKIKSLMVLLHNVQSRRPLADAASRNALQRFETSLVKKYPTQLAGLTTESLREVEGLHEIFDFVDNIEDYETDRTSSRAASEEAPPARRASSVRAAAGRARQTMKSRTATETISEEDEGEGEKSDSDAATEYASADEEIVLDEEEAPPARETREPRGAQTKVNARAQESEEEDEEEEEFSVQGDDASDLSDASEPVGKRSSKAKAKPKPKLKPAAKPIPSKTRGKVAPPQKAKVGGKGGKGKPSKQSESGSGSEAESVGVDSMLDEEDDEEEEGEESD